MFTTSNLVRGETNTLTDVKHVCFLFVARATPKLGFETPNYYNELKIGRNQQKTYNIHKD